MYGTDAMEHGVFPLDYPAVEAFPWPYPVRCGFALDREECLLDPGEDALLVLSLIHI